MQQDDWNAFLAATHELSPGQKYRNDLVLAEVARMVRAANLTEGFTLADFGCGRGDMLVKLREQFPRAKLIGFEYTDSGRLAAAKQVPDAVILSLDLEQASLAHPEWKERIDIGICTEVLEHLDHPDLGLQQIHGYLKPGSLLLVTVPGGPMHQYDKFIGHRQHFDRRTLRQLIAPTFRIDQILRHGFPFFSGYKLLGFIGGKDTFNNLHRPATERSRTMQFLFDVFDRLLKHNLADSWLGWQMVARCRKEANQSTPGQPL